MVGYFCAAAGVVFRVWESYDARRQKSLSCDLQRSSPSPTYRRSPTSLKGRIDCSASFQSILDLFQSNKQPALLLQQEELHNSKQHNHAFSHTTSLRSDPSLLQPKHEGVQSRSCRRCHHSWILLSGVQCTFRRCSSREQKGQKGWSLCQAVRRLDVPIPIRLTFQLTSSDLL